MNSELVVLGQLCSHERCYETVKTEMGLDLADDESVQNHVLRIINNQQYTGMLTIAALFTVIGQPIESIYPSVNENDPYCELLNTVFIPRNKQLSASETPLRLMWSGPEKKLDRIWHLNHFTPVLSIITPSSAIENTASVVDMDNDITYIESNELPSQTALRVSKSRIMHANQLENEKENNTDAKILFPSLIKDRFFSKHLQSFNI